MSKLPECSSAVPNWPGYFVDKQGGVWSTKSGQAKLLVQTMDASDRRWVTLSKPGKTKNFRVHTLILGTFVGPPKSGQICRHKNDIASDNRLCNLAWGTHLQNYEDYLRNSGLPRGSVVHAKRPSAFLTEGQVVELRNMFASGVMIKDLVLIFGISKRSVCRAVHGDSWAHLPMPDYSNRPENRGANKKASQ